MQVAGDSQTRVNSRLNVWNQIEWALDQVERSSKFVFLMPAVLALLFLSIFPLIASLYLSLTRFKFVKGGFMLDFVGLANYKSLLLGQNQGLILGVFAPMGIIHWIVIVVVVLFLLYGIVRYMRSGNMSFGGLLSRVILSVLGAGLALLIARSLIGGRLGSLSVTLLYVFAGIAVQFTIGLGLALLTSQDIWGRRFFRVVFLLPMMITPVGVAYMFKMVTDTGMGPLAPLWRSVGLGSLAWINDPWAARSAIILADTWQWVPFMFIVLLAALESQPVDTVEAATVDGAGPWQIFWHITWPGILPVSLTLILIRMVEAFKIIDLPNVMTGGAPGTATESLTLRSFITWRAFDLGTSAAVAYVLLIVVTLFATVLVQTIRHRALGDSPSASKMQQARG